MRALESVKGVVKAEASFPEKKAVVYCDRERVSADQIGKALLKAGFVGNIVSD